MHSLRLKEIAALTASVALAGCGTWRCHARAEALLNSPLTPRQASDREGRPRAHARSATAGLLQRFRFPKPGRYGTRA